MDETIVVLEGETFRQPAGSVAFIPRGLRHGFSNRGSERARVLIHFSPAGDQHEYFRNSERLFAAPELDIAALAGLQNRFDQGLIRANP